MNFSHYTINRAKGKAGRVKRPVPRSLCRGFTSSRTPALGGIEGPPGGGKEAHGHSHNEPREEHSHPVVADAPAPAGGEQNLRPQADEGQGGELDGPPQIQIREKHGRQHGEAADHQHQSEGDGAYPADRPDGLGRGGTFSRLHGAPPLRGQSPPPQAGLLPRSFPPEIRKQGV